MKISVRIISRVVNCVVSRVTFRCFVVLFALFGALPSAWADEIAKTPAKTEAAAALPAAELPAAELPAGVALSARGQETNAFRLDVWQFEHEKIKAIRATRFHPTERGPWYSYQSREEKIGRTLSDAQFPLVGAQMALLTLQGRDGRVAAIAGVKSVVVTGAITMAIKKTFLRRRPYPNDDQFGTFPSGHTSTSFAMAGITGAAHPNLRVPALLAASGVGWSRIKVRAHHWQDVFAGAALGLVVSHQFRPEKIRGSRVADFRFNF